MQTLSKIDTIKEKILTDIQSGLLKPGDKLYSRHQFMRRYKCSRGSIDKAVSALERDGILFSRQGAGTYVAEKRVDGGEFRKIYLISEFNPMTAFSPGSLAAEIQHYVDCSLCRPRDINITLQKIASPGNAVIWERPEYSQMMIMDYLRNSGVAQLIIHRIYGDYDYITTDSCNGIRAGLEWLTGHAGRNIAYVSSRPQTRYPYIAERQLEFYELAIRMKLKVLPDKLFIDSDRYNCGYKEIEKIAGALFDTQNPAKAVYLDNFLLAEPLLAMAEARGMLPGGDFHMLVFDFAEKLTQTPGVAMIRQNVEGFNGKVIEWILQENRKPMHEKIQPMLIFNK